MQAEQTENELIIRDAPGCLWIAGLLFLSVGGAFVYGALGGFAGWNGQNLWMLAAAFLMGMLGVALGVRLIHVAPITKLVIDRIEETITMTRYGLSGKSRYFYDLDEISEFCLVEEKDSENDSIWFLGMKFFDEEIVKISSMPSHDRLFKQQFVFLANGFTGKQIASIGMPFELAGETGSELE